MWWLGLRQAVFGLASASWQWSSCDGTSGNRVVAEHIRNQKQKRRYYTTSVCPVSRRQGRDAIEQRRTELAREQSRELTSGLEPLACSLRVIINRCQSLHG